MSADVQTLGVWRAQAVAMFGEDSAAVAYLDAEIESQGHETVVGANDPLLTKMMDIHQNGGS